MLGIAVRLILIDPFHAPLTGPYAIHMARGTLTKCDTILIFTSFWNKLSCDIAYFNTKMSYLSNFKRTKVRHLEQPADGWRIEQSRRMIKCKWYEQKIDIWYFESLIIVNTATSYFCINIHVIYVWNGYRERRSSHWHLQLHTRLAERYRWCCADWHSDATTLSWMHLGLQQINKGVLGRCKYLTMNDWTNE